jgi:hypothetical protein
MIMGSLLKLKAEATAKSLIIGISAETKNPFMGPLDEARYAHCFGILNEALLMPGDWPPAFRQVNSCGPSKRTCSANMRSTSNPACSWLFLPATQLPCGLALRLRESTAARSVDIVLRGTAVGAAGTTPLNQNLLPFSRWDEVHCSCSCNCSCCWLLACGERGRPRAGTWSLGLTAAEPVDRHDTVSCSSGPHNPGGSNPGNE